MGALMQTVGGSSTPEHNKIIETLPVAERASYKGREIAKIGQIARTTQGKFQIEVSGLKAVPNGVEFYVRAWDLDGTPIGLGIESKFETEHFIVINPPILVDDPNGNIERNWTDERGFHSRKLREDLREALLQSLERTISTTGKKGTAMAGSVGNTTLTVYPAAGAVSPVDGYVARENPPPEDWNTIRNGAGTGAYPLDASGWNAGLWSLDGGVFTYLYRAYELVDTSAIPDDVTITAAEWNLYFANRSTAMVINETLDLNVVSGIPTADNNLVASDFNISHFGTTVWGELSWNNGIDGQYNAIALNSTGLSNINKTGLSRFGFRLSGDVSGTAPTRTDNTDAQEIYWDWYLADQAGTTNDPKLVVEYPSARRVMIISFLESLMGLLNRLI